MYIVDTNIFLELLLEQEKAKEVTRFFQKIETNELYISDFTIYSIGIILLRFDKPKIFNQWVEDIINSGIKLVRLESIELIALTELATKFNLDFDDAYQYQIAEKYDLQILSYDKDFNKTDRGRKEPGNVYR